MLLLTSQKIPKTSPTIEIDDNFIEIIPNFLPNWLKLIEIDLIKLISSKLLKWIFNPIKY